MQLVWAENVVRKTNKRVLIITPLAVGTQTKSEGDRFGIECARSRDGKLNDAKIIITNYEKLHLFSSSDFVGMAADECFPPFTQVDVFENGCILKKYIQYLRRGDAIFNASGRDRVAEINRRKVERAVKLTV